MGVETEGEPPEDGQTVEGMAHRQGVLEYVSDIALELAALLDREAEADLAADLRQIADRAQKAKYRDPGV